MLKKSKRQTKKFPLNEFTRFGIGGYADEFFDVRTERKMAQLIKLLNRAQREHTVIGEGTNLLVAGNLKNVIIRNNIKGIKKISANTFEVGSGMNLDRLVSYFNNLGLAGLEKMAGIPGGLGGAVAGNAGAYGQEMRDTIQKVRVFNSQNEKVTWLSKKGCRFGYRESIFKKNRGLIILATIFRFSKKEKPETLKKISAKIRRIRNKKFPKTLRCPGSYFKNIVISSLPPALRKKTEKTFQDKIIHDKLPAGAVIDIAGFKGKQIGQIKIADYHGNLIMNLGDGDYRDVLKLANKIKKVVKNKFGLTLEEEVRILR